ncbi:MAG: hypothetical protein J3Q66DRAFT_167513, partial [Benniella sp.]
SLSFLSSRLSLSWHLFYLYYTPSSSCSSSSSFPPLWPPICSLHNRASPQTSSTPEPSSNPTLPHAGASLRTHVSRLRAPIAPTSKRPWSKSPGAPISPTSKPSSPEASSSSRTLKARVPIATGSPRPPGCRMPPWQAQRRPPLYDRLLPSTGKSRHNSLNPLHRVQQCNNNVFRTSPCNSPVQQGSAAKSHSV